MGLLIPMGVWPRNSSLATGPDSERDDMGVRKYKPTSPGRRNASVSDFAEITATRPEKSAANHCTKPVAATIRDISRRGTAAVVQEALPSNRFPA